MKGKLVFNLLGARKVRWNQKYEVFIFSLCHQYWLQIIHIQSLFDETLFLVLKSPVLIHLAVCFTSVYIAPIILHIFCLHHIVFKYFDC